jgi:hypothetical protein
MDAVHLADEIHALNLSPVEVVEAVRARMDRLEPVLHQLGPRVGESDLNQPLQDSSNLALHRQKRAATRLS